MESWGWRVPFFAGSLIALVALTIRTQVRETPLFDELLSEGKTVRSPLKDGLRCQWRAVLLTFAGCLPRSFLLPRGSLRAGIPCIVCQRRPRRGNARWNSGKRFQRRVHRDPRWLADSRYRRADRAGLLYHGGFCHCPRVVSSAKGNARG
jgi:hypothetical protein